MSESFTVTTYPTGMGKADVSIDTDTQHVDGVPWHEAPLPRRFHRCKAQTTGWINYCGRVERCACGSRRLNRRGGWMDRNSRRR